MKPTQRLELGDLLVEHIYDRTTRGLDKDGKAFPGYSAAYIKSLAFRNAGKSKNRVDLQLTGDMLAGLKVLSHKAGKITLGFDKGTLENAKAEGNILGTYGSKQPDPNKARDFLGVQGRKLKELIDYVR